MKNGPGENFVSEAIGAGNQARGRETLLCALVFLAGLGVLLQGLWAGIFLEHDGSRDAAGSWIDVHARGADISIGVACLAFVLSVLWFRRDSGLIAGLAAFIVVMFAESYIGGLIRDNGKDTLTSVHVPLAMAAMGLAAWLAARVWRMRRA